MNKCNYWKLATIMLIVVLVLLVTFIEIRKPNEEKKINLIQFNISESNYNSFVDYAKDNNLNKFTIVEIETGKAVTLYKT